MEEKKGSFLDTHLHPFAFNFSGLHTSSTCLILFETKGLFCFIALWDTFSPLAMHATVHVKKNMLKIRRGSISSYF